MMKLNAKLMWAPLCATVILFMVSCVDGNNNESNTLVLNKAQKQAAIINVLGTKSGKLYYYAYDRNKVYESRLDSTDVTVSFSAQTDTTATFSTRIPAKVFASYAMSDSDKVKTAAPFDITGEVGTYAYQFKDFYNKGYVQYGVATNEYQTTIGADKYTVTFDNTDQVFFLGNQFITVMDYYNKEIGLTLILKQVQFNDNTYSTIRPLILRLK